MTTNRGRPAGATDKRQRKPRTGSTRFGAPLPPGVDPKPRVRASRKADQDRALQLLIEGNFVKDIAAELSIPYSTIQRWMTNDVVFRAKLDEANRAIREGVTQRALGRAGDVMDKLIHIALNGTKEDGPGVNAAKHALAIAGVAPVVKIETTVGPYDFSRMSEDDLKAQIAARAKQLGLVQAIPVEPEPDDGSVDGVADVEIE